MAWVQIIDKDRIGSTPEAYTDADGDTTQMTVTTTGGKVVDYPENFDNRWVIGEESHLKAEAHFHNFTNPVHVLRIDIENLDLGDFANFAYTDTSGNVVSINVADWIANGDAVVNIGTGHLIANLPTNLTLNGVEGTNLIPGAQGGTTSIEFTFPTGVTQFIVGRNIIAGAGLKDAFSYKLFYDDHASVVCFAKGTNIDADKGKIAIENLTVGDLVWTKDHGLQPIRWIGSRRLGHKQLALHPNLCPIHIQMGALGPRLPVTDLTVSPQHRILLRSTIARQMFDSDEVLVAAKHLLGLDGIDVVQDVSEVEYFHVLFDQHEIIFANGAETESLYPGPQAIKSLSVAAQNEIFFIFPELAHRESIWRHSPARPVLTGRMGRAYVDTITGRM